MNHQKYPKYSSSSPSGYGSSVGSTPTTPNMFKGRQKQRMTQRRRNSRGYSIANSLDPRDQGFFKSDSMESSDSSHHSQGFSLTAAERRKRFVQRQKYQSEFKEVLEKDDSSFEDEQKNIYSVEDIEDSLGEWRIPFQEIKFCQKLVDGGRFGHDIYTGKWHGDVVIHSYKADNNEESSNNVAKSKKKNTHCDNSYNNCIGNVLKNIRTLTQIRHENIVLYMGACVSGTETNPKSTYHIVTNPVKARSLYTALRSGGDDTAESSDFFFDDQDSAVSIAKQLSNAVGYLHAKNIVHGRISSRNVFLESRIQLSLLDYALGKPNTAYSSPQVLSKVCYYNKRNLKPAGGEDTAFVYRGQNKSDDVFAFGSLLFELFSSGRRLPFEGEVEEEVIAAKIRAGSLPRCLSSDYHHLIGERLKKLIQRCWSYEARARPTFQQMGPHFAKAVAAGGGPQSGLCRRRFSTSEPRLDQAK